MPIYEYRCRDCGHELDALQKISDDPLEDCPACGQASLRRLISAPAFRLKGGGWYETDFKSDKERRRNLAEGSDAGASDASSSGKGEGKGEPKSDTPASKQSDAGAGKDKVDSKKKEATAGPKGSGTEAA